MPIHITTHEGDSSTEHDINFRLSKYVDYEELRITFHTNRGTKEIQFVLERDHPIIIEGSEELVAMNDLHQAWESIFGARIQETQDEEARNTLILAQSIGKIVGPYWAKAVLGYADRNFNDAIDDMKEAYYGDEEE
jgi:hypothetical protein